MMETPLTTMDVHQLANPNAEMDLSLELRNVIWELPMPTPPTNANLIAESQDAVMVMLIPLRNVIMLPQDNPLLPAETTANSPSVEMVPSIPLSVKSVMLDQPTTMFHPLVAQLVAHKTLVDFSDPPALETSTELWLVQDASMPTLVQPPDPLAVDQFNGWLPSLFKRSLNSKLTNSLISLEPTSEDLNVEIANSLTHTTKEDANAFLKLETLPLQFVLPVLPSQESPLFKPHSTFWPPTLLRHQSSNKLS